MQRWQSAGRVCSAVLFLALVGLFLSAPNRAQEKTKTDKTSDPKQAAVEQEKAKTKTTVKLTIDFGDGFQKSYTQLEWKEKQTVADLLQLASKHPHGITVMTKGKGEFFFVMAIDDAINEGRGRNWVYEVNGKLGEKSAGLFDLQAGDDVLWRFGKYR